MPLLAIPVTVKDGPAERQLPSGTLYTEKSAPAGTVDAIARVLLLPLFPAISNLGKRRKGVHNVSSGEDARELLGALITAAKKLPFAYITGIRNVYFNGEVAWFKIITPTVQKTSQGGGFLSGIASSLFGSSESTAQNKSIFRSDDGSNLEEPVLAQKALSWLQNPFPEHINAAYKEEYTAAAEAAAAEAAAAAGGQLRKPTKTLSAADYLTQRLMLDADADAATADPHKDYTAAFADYTWASAGLTAAADVVLKLQAQVNTALTAGSLKKGRLAQNYSAILRTFNGSYFVAEYLPNMLNALAAVEGVSANSEKPVSVPWIKDLMLLQTSDEFHSEDKQPATVTGSARPTEQEKSTPCSKRMAACNMEYVVSVLFSEKKEAFAAHAAAGAAAAPAAKSKKGPSRQLSAGERLGVLAPYAPRWKLITRGLREAFVDFSKVVGVVKFNALKRSLDNIIAKMPKIAVVQSSSSSSSPSSREARPKEEIIDAEDDRAATVAFSVMLALFYTASEAFMNVSDVGESLATIYAQTFSAVVRKTPDEYTVFALVAYITAWEHAAPFFFSLLEKFIGNEQLTLKVATLLPNTILSGGLGNTTIRALSATPLFFSRTERQFGRFYMEGFSKVVPSLKTRDDITSKEDATRVSQKNKETLWKALGNPQNRHGDDVNGYLLYFPDASKAVLEEIERNEHGLSSHRLPETVTLLSAAAGEQNDSPASLWRSRSVTFV